MEKIIKEDLELERVELPRQEAIDFRSGKGESYKVELIEDLPEDSVISFYRQREFVDLCAGPHVPSTGKVKSFKLLSLAGAYWRGDETIRCSNAYMEFHTPRKASLTNTLNRWEEAKKRDHRRLGVNWTFSSILEEGPGFPFFHSKGMVLRNILESFGVVSIQRGDMRRLGRPLS